MKDGVNSARRQLAEELVEQGRAAMRGGNAAEALLLFSRAQKADSDCISAYLGRAEAAGQCSTVEDMRFSEMLGDLCDVIRLNARAPGQEALPRVTSLFKDVTSRLWEQSVERFRDSASVDATDASWIAFVGQAKEILWAFERVLSFGSENEALLRKMLSISKDFLQGFPHTAEDGVARVHRLGPEDEKIFREWKEKTVYRIRRLDPAYETPEV